MGDDKPFLVLAFIVVVEGVSSLRPDLPRELLPEDGRGSHDKTQRGNHAAHQGSIDDLALAGFFPGIERGGHAPCAHQSPDLITDPGKDLSGRPSPLPACQHKPASGNTRIVKGEGMGLGSLATPA